MRAEQGARGAATRPARTAERGVRVALIGWGTIGSGVIQLLRENAEALAGRLGAPLELARVADIDLERRREVRVPVEGL